MLIAGEASGDAHAATLVQALRRRLTTGHLSALGSTRGACTSFAPRFFGAGGPRMAEAGVQVEVDMTAHAVLGLTEALRKINHFRRLGRQLVSLACRRLPDVIVLVDFGGFNLRFAAEIRRCVQRQRGVFGNWRPRIVYFVSPQVWASREGRADRLARDVDLLLSIFPFEKAWYARRAPSLRVEFVGHPLVDRFAKARPRVRSGESSDAADAGRESEAPGTKSPVRDAADQRRSTLDRGTGAGPIVLLLPGSRRQEVRRHLPILVEAVRQLGQSMSVRPWMALPTEELLELAEGIVRVRRSHQFPAEHSPPSGDGAIWCRVGDISDLMSGADLAIAKSGSVTLECAFHRLPTVVMYRVTWPTWWMARSIVRVPFAAMPNLLAGKEIYPELLQGRATPETIAREAEDLLRDGARRRAMRKDLEGVTASLGAPGAADRAAAAIVDLLAEP